MIAFTDDCHRIGYGGGFYDMTLNLYERKKILTIGLSFQAQRVPDEYAYKPDPHDKILDHIITEVNVYHSNL